MLLLVEWTCPTSYKVRLKERKQLVYRGFPEHVSSSLFGLCWLCIYAYIALICKVVARQVQTRINKRANIAPLESTHKRPVAPINSCSWRINHRCSHLQANSAWYALHVSDDGFVIVMQPAGKRDMCSLASCRSLEWFDAPRTANIWLVFQSLRQCTRHIPVWRSTFY